MNVCFLVCPRHKKRKLLSGRHTTSLLNKERQSKMKSVSIVFFDLGDVDHKDFVYLYCPSGQTVNTGFYVEIPNWLEKRIVDVCQRLPTQIVHHNNVSYALHIGEGGSGETNDGNATPSTWPHMTSFCLPVQIQHERTLFWGS